ncbi:hypothetical protein I4641_13955 [Waterburya agarophytonicola K14]|uniref:DUF4261 domain-containing protein n=1 Tax=Waterburya agarophytonicola KI4 TaxID=2874699 RepID=A0A964BUD1_9CYAN|nr:hypothetical protein [Waterburya agarophytonicola]MCC0178085.1 hypothetical protein [Waterburya agarophytonicola KI4]
MSNQIVVSIPITLNNRQKIANALWDKYGTDYLFIGRVFQETTTNQSCAIEIIQTIDPMTECDQAIIYLTSHDVGYQACLTIARFAQVLLNIGGIAVKIESAELTHKSNKWLSNYNSQDVFEIYSLYVGLIEGEDTYYSCGMHNFGKADVFIGARENICLAIYVMNVFNYYRLTESPILQDKHTFQPDIESPTYQMKLLEDREYEATSLQYNPFGRWYLYRC